jgi:lipopolysaccharide biosynthesis regulator YciM
MRRYIAISLLLLYVFSATELHEWLKLPQLAMHYQEHQKKEHKLTLWSFICEHYAHGDVFDKDRNRDMKLPFKSIDCTSSIVITIIPVVLQIEMATWSTFYKERTPNKFYLNSFCSSNYGSIWQPPKIA